MVKHNWMGGKGLGMPQMRQWRRWMEDLANLDDSRDDTNAVIARRVASPRMCEVARMILRDNPDFKGQRDLTHRYAHYRDFIDEERMKYARYIEAARAEYDVFRDERRAFIENHRARRNPIPF